MKTVQPERSSAPRNELMKSCWFQQTERKRVLWDLQRCAQWPRIPTVQGVEHGRNWDNQCPQARRGCSFQGGPSGSENEQRRTRSNHDRDLRGECCWGLPSGNHDFSRKRMVDQLGAPPQSVGHASASGWTDAGLFLKWMKHVVLYINASTQNRHLIVLDEHHSHKTMDGVNYARAHRIELITLPPHCTHKMQPLYRCFFKSLKSAYNVSADN